MISSLIERGFGCLQDSVAMVTAAESSSSTLSLAESSCCSRSDLQLSLYQYCDRFLRLAESPGELTVACYTAEILFCTAVSYYYRVIFSAAY